MFQTIHTLYKLPSPTKDNPYFCYYPRKYIDYNIDDLVNQLDKKDDLSNLSEVKGRDTYCLELLDIKIPFLISLTNYIKEDFSLSFDYVLIQVYHNGQAGISWHNDKEALDSEVLSISFGAMRTFWLREIANKKKVYKQFLQNGDVFLMKKGCNQVYQHAVLKESKVKGKRISLTFRKYESDIQLNY